MISNRYMSCNAYNHPPNCNCGWGGQGRSSGRITTNGGYNNRGHFLNKSSNFYTENFTEFIQENKPEIFEVSKPQKQSFDQLQLDRCKEIGESKTYPTICWWCGAEVFYHTNGYGDCVLFDELGYPWQIHSCWQDYWSRKKSHNTDIAHNVTISINTMINLTIDSLKINELPIKQQENIVKQGQEIWEKLDILKKVIDQTKYPTEQNLTKKLAHQFFLYCVDDFRLRFKNLYIVYLNSYNLKSYVETIDRWENKGIQKYHDGDTYYLPKKKNRDKRRSSVVKNSLSQSKSNNSHTPRHKNVNLKSKKKYLDKSHYFFQGIGYLGGYVYYSQETFWIKQQDQIFELLINNPIIKVHLHKMLELKRSLNDYIYLYLRVYPQCIWSDNLPNIQFHLLKWQEEPFVNSNGEQETISFFTLRGIWQFIPNYKFPVLSIYQNKNSHKQEKIKPIHLPIKMKREDCKPFSNRTHNDKYFISGKFKFLPKLNAFGWREDIDEPTSDIPDFIE